MKQPNKDGPTTISSLPRSDCEFLSFFSVRLRPRYANSLPWTHKSVCQDSATSNWIERDVHVAHVEACRRIDRHFGCKKARTSVLASDAWTIRIGLPMGPVDLPFPEPRRRAVRSYPPAQRDISATNIVCRVSKPQFVRRNVWGVRAMSRRPHREATRLGSRWSNRPLTALARAR